MNRGPNLWGLHDADALADACALADDALADALASIIAPANPPAPTTAMLALGLPPVPPRLVAPLLPADAPEANEADAEAADDGACALDSGRERVRASASESDDEDTDDEDGAGVRTIATAPAPSTSS